MMNKRLIFIIIFILVIIFGFYFFIYKRDNFDKNPIDLSYQEPTPGFFDKSLVVSRDKVVKITDIGFEPGTITIKKGEKITWINETSGYIWPASNPHPTHTDYPGFDAQLPMKTNQAWSFTFYKTGSWGYHDHLNPTSRGVVIVQD